MRTDGTLGSVSWEYLHRLKYRAASTVPPHMIPGDVRKGRRALSVIRWRAPTPNNVRVNPQTQRLFTCKRRPKQHVGRIKCNAGFDV